MTACEPSHFLSPSAGQSARSCRAAGSCWGANSQFRPVPNTPVPNTPVPNTCLCPRSARTSVQPEDLQSEQGSLPQGKRHRRAVKLEAIERTSEDGSSEDPARLGAYGFPRSGPIQLCLPTAQAPLGSLIPDRSGTGSRQQPPRPFQLYSRPAVKPAWIAAISYFRHAQEPGQPILVRGELGSRNRSLGGFPKSSIAFLTFTIARTATTAPASPRPRFT
jgi:hypothetical protein